ncbi:MAG: hypothetical protein ACRDCE_18060 [Cetobacterium sp.]|uniref:hypothetical protein n=1 Tax=Cetobacterium sp. TaxID=2071632 RepID=UPI003EE6714A
MADLMMTDADMEAFWTNELSEDTTTTKAAPADVEEEMEYDFLSDDSDEFEEVEDNTENEEEGEEASNEELDEVEQFTKTFTDKWDIIDDDHVFDFGDVQLTKADLADAAIAREEHKKLRDSLLNYSNEFEEMNKQTDLSFQAARIEAQGYLENIRAKLKRGEFQGVAKAKAYEDIERLEARMEVIHKEAAKAQEIHQAREAKMSELRIHLVDKEMNKKYGAEWGKTIAPRVVQYATANGIPQELLVKHVSGPLLEMFIKASQYDNLKAEGKSKVNKAMKKGTTARSTSKGKLTAPQTKRMSKTRAYEKAKASGDMAALFDLIED